MINQTVKVTLIMNKMKIKIKHTPNLTASSESRECTLMTVKVRVQMKVRVLRKDQIVLEYIES